LNIRPEPIFWNRGVARASQALATTTSAATPTATPNNTQRLRAFRPANRFTLPVIWSVTLATTRVGLLDQPDLLGGERCPGVLF